MVGAAVNVEKKKQRNQGKRRERAKIMGVVHGCVCDFYFYFFCGKVNI